MSNIIQSTSADKNAAAIENRNELGLQSTTTLQETEGFPAVFSDDSFGQSNNTPKAIKQFQPLRFTVGLCCTASGVAIILGIGLRVVEMQDVSNDFAMPLIAVCVLTGVMLLGGGFGVMATSSSGFDEAEFDRLATAGNISAVSQSEPNDTGTAEMMDSQQSAA